MEQDLEYWCQRENEKHYKNDSTRAQQNTLNVLHPQNLVLGIQQKRLIRFSCCCSTCKKTKTSKHSRHEDLLLFTPDYFQLCQVNFHYRRVTLPLTHLDLQGSTALCGSPHAIVGYAAVNAIVAVFHTQDGEELSILSNAVPGVKEPEGHRGQDRSAQCLLFAAFAQLTTLMTR